MAYDFIAFDMDGTLLDTKKHILPSTLEAIRVATNAGKVVAIATGRSPSLMLPYREQLPDVSYVICTSGAQILDLRQDCLLVEHNFDSAVIRNFLRPIVARTLCSRSSRAQRRTIPQAASSALTVLWPWGVPRHIRAGVSRS